MFLLLQLWLTKWLCDIFFACHTQTHKHPNIDKNNCAHTQTFPLIPVCEIFSTVGNNVARHTVLSGERAGTRTHSGGKVMMETLKGSRGGSPIYYNIT